jgi:hypothetical protein
VPPVFQMLTRLALIDLLIVLSPVAALPWLLPRTQGWFRWWADLFPITVFQQAIQVMVQALHRVEPQRVERRGKRLLVDGRDGGLNSATHPRA